MRNDRPRRLFSAKLTAATLMPLVVSLAGAARAELVGTAGAVNPASRGTPPSAATRVIEIGSQVVRRERIQTSAAGSVQLVFIDKTTLNIGPNSDMVIDEFVYDPDKSAGKLSASLARGAMRFVGGQISHSGGAVIRTPASTIGVRGGVATISHDARDGTRAIGHFGTLEISNQAGSEIIRRPGFEVVIAGAGQPPSQPFRVTQADLEAINRALTSKGGQSGGARNKPTPAKVLQAGVGSQSDGLAPENVRSIQAQNLAQSARDFAAQAARNGYNLNQTVQQSQQATAAAVTAQQNPPPKPPQPPQLPGGGPAEQPGAPLFGFVGGLITGESRPTGSEPEAVGPGIAQVAGIMITPGASSTPISIPTGPGNPSITLSQTWVSSSATKGEFPGVSYCACEYTQWGRWVINATRESPEERLTIKADLFWVAGRQPSAAEIPLTGTASYSGHMIGNFSDGGNPYSRAGNFSATVNFGAGSGTVNVPNLDGYSYSGNITQSSLYLGGSLQGRGVTTEQQGRSAIMDLAGTFFRGSTSPVQDIGGRFSVTGADSSVARANANRYFGAGIFAGSRP